MTQPRLHILITCSNRKRATPAPPVRVAELCSREPEGRIREWISALSRCSNRVVADRLYVGDHWSIGRSLPRLADQFDATLWILSAGYGLVTPLSPLSPYSATFSPGQADSISCSGSSDEARSWWNSLCRWNRHDWNHPRSIQALVQAYPSDYFLLVASEPYLVAVQEDLREALDWTTDPERFLLISAGAGHLDRRLAHHLLPCDARLRTNLGGAMQSLNVRIARDLLSRSSPAAFRLTEMKAEFESRNLSLAQLERYHRRHLNDQEVTSFIVENPLLSCTASLRKLRASGFACEQGRFAQLYKGVAS